MKIYRNIRLPILLIQYFCVFSQTLSSEASSSMSSKFTVKTAHQTYRPDQKFLSSITFITLSRVTLSCRTHCFLTVPVKLPTNSQISIHTYIPPVYCGVQVMIKYNYNTQDYVQYTGVTVLYCTVL